MKETIILHCSKQSLESIIKRAKAITNNEFKDAGLGSDFELDVDIEEIGDDMLQVDVSRLNKTKVFLLGMFFFEQKKYDLLGILKS